MNNCLEIKSWKTPATDYPLNKCGSAELMHYFQPKGYYRMEGVNGYVFYHQTKAICITSLVIDGKVWMIDDPLHWIGMQALAGKSFGNVLFAGLGLGLVVHPLLENPKVESITAVEINKDVIGLIKPMLPKSKKLRIINDDIFKFKTKKEINTVLLDIWVGNGTTEMRIEMLNAFGALKLRYPNAMVYIWGHGETWLNPSINEQVRFSLPKEYWSRNL